MDKELKEKLDKYFKEQETIRQKVKEERKRKDLMQRGLYEIETSKEYVNGSVYNQKTGLYEKRVPLEVSDEEYEKIRKYQYNKPKKFINTFQSMIATLGIIYLIISIFMGFYSGSLLFAIFIWLSGIIIAFLSVGLSDALQLIIKLKEDINDLK